MPRINPEGQVTRAERLVTVIAIAAAVLVHLVAILGWGRVYRWAQEEQKKERLMVIRRVRDVAPPRETIPVPPRSRQVPAGAEGKVGGGEKAAPPPPEPKVKERGPEPPKETELSPAMEQELEEVKPDQSQLTEQGDSAVSVVTDLPAASFVVGGPAEYRGSGTYWVRKGAPPGRYTVTFNPIAGFATPPVQTKDLLAKGQIVFLGKYRRSTELVVDSNQRGAQFTIYRPDGRPLDLNRPGRTLLDDLPPGTYTAVFKDIPGYVTPPPLSRTLSPGGKLTFFGDYSGGTGAGVRAETEREQVPGVEAAAAAARGRRVPGAAGKAPGRAAGPPHGAEMDRRVQMIVTSYPPSRIEEDYPAIPYPGVIIRKSNFQQGWCQVYLVLEIDDDGEVRQVGVERPQAGDRPQFEALIKAVEGSVRAWDYDKVRAEVHVDVRFYVE